MKQFIIDDPNKKLKNAKDIEGFIDENGCYICTSHNKRHDGRYYGIKRNGRQYLVHRYVYEIKHGAIPEGCIVMHKCDNNLCINPDHLEIGTHQENMKDMVSRGRSFNRSRNPNAKLTVEQVNEIRELLEEGDYVVSDLAKNYNVSRRLIYMIRDNVV